MLEYKDFREKIRQVLAGAGSAGLTWTEIRTIAKLPQAFPNNQWVHRLEADIGLERKKDGHGIIQWRLGKDNLRAATQPADPAVRASARPTTGEGKLE